jgi:hypothetical protein
MKKRRMIRPPWMRKRRAPPSVAKGRRMLLSWLRNWEKRCKPLNLLFPSPPPFI